jgi:hypothetical protein
MEKRMRIPNVILAILLTIELPLIPAQAVTFTSDQAPASASNSGDLRGIGWSNLQANVTRHYSGPSFAGLLPDEAHLIPVE